MGSKPVPDEYFERYRNLSHNDLYAMLNAGNPDQVDDLASKWKSLQNTADYLATTLAGDLDRLRGEWDSESGHEFARRVGLIASYAQTLAGELGHMKDGLTLMSGPLRETKRQAESPASTDDHDKVLKDAAGGAMIGGAVAGPGGAVIGGVIGGLMGHNQDEEEKEKARQRMIQLVAGLAAEYDVTSQQTWPQTVATAPVDLPGNGSGGSVDLRGGLSGRTAGTVPLTGTADPGVRRDADDPTRAGAVPLTGTGDPGGTGTDPDATAHGDTSLLGSGAVVGAGAGGASAGIAAVTRGGVRGGDAGFTGVASAMGGIVGGVLGGFGDRPERENRSAAAAGDQARRGTSGGRSENGDEPDERTTWLTEDDMVWGGDEEAAPAVLGADQIKAGEPVEPAVPDDEPGAGETGT